MKMKKLLEKRKAAKVRDQRNNKEILKPPKKYANDCRTQNSFNYNLFIFCITTILFTFLVLIQRLHLLIMVTATRY